MARFVVLDHSLTRVGGHHYEQAVQVLRAATSRGYQAVLATHRRFKQQKLLPASWQVLPLFADESYDCLDDYPLDIHGTPLRPHTSEAVARRTRARRPGWLWRIRLSLDCRQRRRRIERFAEACRRLHQAVSLRSGDQVFVPTTSLFDLLGLVRFLQGEPVRTGVVWHALFHYGFLQGREQEYAAQGECQRRVGQQLRYLLDAAAGAQLRLYGTTQRLADQFNRLGVCPFGVLPFPVDRHAFRNDARSLRPAVLRLTCAGFLRREKGKQLASDLVRGLWPDELRPGHVQLLVQTNWRRARRMLPAEARLPVRLRSALDHRAADPIIWLRHPLTRDAYIDLVRSSDIAVFLHDGRAYYTRCSGVLIEMLSGGIPVLVPAGSWLADQVADAIYDHLAQVAQDATRVGHCGPQHLRWAADQGPPLTPPSAGHSPPHAAPNRGRLTLPEVPDGASFLLLEMQLDKTVAPGTFVRLVVEQQRATAARPVKRDDAVVGPGIAGPVIRHLVAIHPAASSLTVTLTHAYGGVLGGFHRFSASLLRPPRNGPATYPLGKVGLVFSDVGQVPGLVREMRQHYEHYRTTARQFAQQWRREHDAAGVVDRLLRARAPAAGAVA